MPCRSTNRYRRGPTALKPPPRSKGRGGDELDVLLRKEGEREALAGDIDADIGKQLRDHQESSLL